MLILTRKTGEQIMFVSKVKNQLEVTVTLEEILSDSIHVSVVYDSNPEQVFQHKIRPHKTLSIHNGDFREPELYQLTLTSFNTRQIAIGVGASDNTKILRGEIYNRMNA